MTTPEINAGQPGRARVAGILATHALHLVDAIRNNAATGLSDDRPGMERAAQLVARHQHNLLSDDEPAGIKTLLDALSSAPSGPVVPAVSADQVTITADGDGSGVLLHLPEITYLDTQVWSADIGLTNATLCALRDVANIHLDGKAPVAVADAELAVVDRSSILREAAFAVGSDTQDIRYGSATDYANRHANLLHRMADEAQLWQSTAEKAAALGLTDAEYRARSHAAAIAMIRAAISGTYATVGAQLEAVLNEADEAQQAAPEEPTEEDIVRGHVTTVHLIGEQLATVDTWLWARLAEVRDTEGVDRRQRPRCPHCQMPHDLAPGSMLVLVCAATRQRIADAEERHAEGDHTLCCLADCDVPQQRGTEAQQGADVQQSEDST